MAEESSDSLVTPEKIKLDGRSIRKNSALNSGSLSNGRRIHADHRRASIGSYHAGDSSTQNSTEKSDFANSSQNVVPRYLRASTGSCHDFCKYGRKYLFEEKARKPQRKRIGKPLPNELSPLQMTVSVEQKKEKVVGQKLPADANIHPPRAKLSPHTKSYSPKPETSLDKKKVVKHKPVTDTKNSSADLPSSNAKSYLQKPKTSSDAKIYSPRKNASSGNKALVPKYEPSSSKKFPSPDPPEIVKSLFFPSKKVEDPVKQGSSSDNKMPRAEKKSTYLSKQHTSRVTSKPVKVKESSPSDNSDGISRKGQRNTHAQTGHKMTALKASAKKVLAPSAVTLSCKLSVVKTASIKSRKAGNLKLVSPLKDRNRIRIKTETSNQEKVSEKTLHVIRIETENNVIESIPGDNATSSLTSLSADESLSDVKSSSLSPHEEDNKEIEYNGGEAVEFISDNNESLEIGEVPSAKENPSKTQRKNRVMVSEDRYSSPVKLKFRSGKVVDLQSDNNSPKRLRFRRARVMGAEDGKGVLRRRTFKKAGVNDDTDGVKHSSEKVVLKHQDMQGKKDARGLLNNVIEETASKLVESRKSKVKALVGAFETVISLQDSNPSSQAVS